jgi:hypothetical protein
MPQPYEWPTLREWLIWHLDLFLSTYRNDGPWAEYRRLISRSLDRSRFTVTDGPAREAVLYITDVINEPCHEEEVRYLTRCQQVIFGSESAEDALRSLERVYEEVFG